MPEKKNIPKTKKSVSLSKKAMEEMSKWIKKFRKIIEVAKQKDLNESDTSNIINDMLGEVWGYDKYFDVTTEYKIKGQYCDYGIKINGQLSFLIEVKAIGVQLNDNHLFQAMSYAGNEGVKRLVLTNLKEWKLYHLTFGEKIEKMEILSINFLEETPAKLQSLVQYLHKESFQKNIVDHLRKQKLALCDDNIQKVLFSKGMISKFKSELKKTTGVKIWDQEAIELIKWCLD